jgi:aspartate racemase
MTRRLGIVAVSAEGAALCYRTVCAEGAAVLGPHAHPEVTIHAYSLADYVRHIDAGRWEEVAAMLLSSAEKLRAAGADVLICPDNTVHQAVDLLRDRAGPAPLPWLHIAEEVAEEAARRGFRRLLLLGTRRLMEGPVYPARLRPRAIERELPEPHERERIDAIIFDELVKGRFEAPARAYLVDVIAQGRRRGADAAVLGCTEIPLLIGDADAPLPVLDSTRILARAALREVTREPAAPAPLR